MQLSIIIPAYNEENRLPLALDKIFEYLAIHYQGDYEVIVASDGSTDRTVEIATSYQKRHPELRLLKFTRNRGRGAVARDAVFETKGKFILETDANGSVNEHAIVDFLNYFSKHPEVDMLIGSRTIKGSRILTPQTFTKKIFGYGFFFLTKIFFGWPIMDCINAFKMYRRETALDVFKYQYENGFISKTEVVYIAKTRGWQIRELPILWIERGVPKIRMFVGFWQSFLGLLRIFIRSQKGLYKANTVINKKSGSGVESLPKHYQNVLITGGCGFIGSNFVRYFYHNRPKSRIVNLDLLTYAGNLENLRDVEGLENKLPEVERRYQFRQGDVCDQSLLDELFEKHRFDLVIHFAAESHVDRSIFNMSEFVRTNIEGTRVLIEVARRNGVKRFIHISTDEVYGSIKDGYASEDWSLKPSNPYSASKAGADLLVQSYIRTHDFPAVIVRGSNNYGPYQYPEKLIPIAVTNLLEVKKIPVHGYGLHVRNWLHVYDFCRAIDIIAHSDAKHRIYNVAGEEKTNHAVLEAIARTLGKNLYDHCFHVSDRPGADLRYAVDASRLEREFGWRRIYNFEEQIGKVVQWYVDQSDWWRNIRLKKGFIEHYERQAKGQWC